MREAVAAQPLFRGKQSLGILLPATHRRRPPQTLQEWSEGEFLRSTYTLLEKLLTLRLKNLRGNPMFCVSCFKKIDA